MLQLVKQTALRVQRTHGDSPTNSSSRRAGCCRRHWFGRHKEAFLQHRLLALLLLLRPDASGRLAGI
jgi:hypothetical protein